MRELTTFKFFINTPLVDFQNTILFESNVDRDDFFLNQNHYQTIDFENMKFNFVRDRQTIRLPISYMNFSGVNYCTFYSEIEPSFRFYAFVVSYRYIAPEQVEVNLLIDGIMTYCQGNVINNFRNLSVTRKHMDLLEYKERLSELKNNDDVIKTFTKRYTDENSFTFKNFYILIQSSCSFEADFGTVDDPKIETSTGGTFDKITSPVNLYVVEQSQFKNLMNTLSPFPWIAQNIRSVSLIPWEMLEGKTENVTMDKERFQHLMKLKDNEESSSDFLDSSLQLVNKDMKELSLIFDLRWEDDQHLLRNEYTTTEIYTYDGQQLFIDNGCLGKDGLLFKSVFVGGYTNEIGIYIDGYKADDGLRGSFLNDAIFFRHFDDIPIMIDNYTLSMSQNANRRDLAESRLISNRISDIADSSTDIMDRFYNSASLISNISPVNLFGKFNDEHEFYKNQIAEFKDMALTTPTITGQSNNNSMGIARDYFGLHVKNSQPESKEWKKIKTYYKMFGFQVDDENSQVNVFTNTICNYVQFKGNVLIPNADVSIVEMIRAQFENGIRFWHNNGTSNPMNQDIMLNRIKGSDVIG